MLRSCSLSLLLFLASGPWALGSSAKPNIVFILADDLGWADTTLYGHTKLYQTPHLDRLAKRGMTFTRAYSASPLCSPTRASILTGENPARIGLTTPNCHTGKVVLKATPGKSGNPGKKAVGPNPVSRLDTKYFTLAERLQEEGYATGHFGKWHLGIDPHSPLQHGFDVDIPDWHGPGPAGSFVAPWKYPDFDPQTPDEHIEDRMAEEAVAWMEKQKDQPFLLNYWMFSVHAPFDAKADLIEKYRSKVDPNDPQRSPTYAAMVESMDDAVGTLLDALDRLKIADNTIIIFFSDNGGNMYNEIDGTTPTSNAPLRGGKASMFEGGVRVPMIVAWPDHIKPATTNDTLVQSTDFYPTILEMLALQPKPQQTFDGVSILPALQGKPQDRGAIFTYFPHDPPVPDWIPPSVSVHKDHWKLIREFHQGEEGAHRCRLFNLKEDLGEKNNLANQNPAKVTELDALITAFLADTKAVLPIPNPAFDPAKYKPELEGKNRVRNAPKPKTRGAQKGAQADTPFDPKLQGWKARQSTTTIADGVVTITGIAADPFLGIGLAQYKGPTTLSFRVRSLHPGTGKISWANGTPAMQSKPFTIKRGRWHELTVELPADGSLGIVRLHLPAEKHPIELDWVALKNGAQSQRWDF
jgi:arylsulfatase A-like enzyme